MSEKQLSDSEAFPFLSDSTFPEEEEENENGRRKRHQYWQTVAASICVGLIFASVVWASAWLQTLPAGTTQRDSAPALGQETHCGHSHEAAVANDCRFQLWSYSWVPSDCFDNELHDEFLSLQAKEQWGYFSDRSVPPGFDWHRDNSLLTQIDLEEVLTGTRNDLHSTWGQHYWHCAFYMRRFFREMGHRDDKRRTDVTLTNREYDQEHIEHCQMWIADPSMYPWEQVRINLTVGYNRCTTWR